MEPNVAASPPQLQQSSFLTPVPTATAAAADFPTASGLSRSGLGVSCATPNLRWTEVLYSDITARNRRESASFRPLLDAYSKVLVDYKKANKTNADLSSQLKGKDARIAQLLEAEERRKQELTQLDSLSTLQNSLSEKEKHVSELVGIKIRDDKELAQLREDSVKKDALIAELQDKIKQLDGLLDSERRRSERLDSTLKIFDNEKNSLKADNAAVRQELENVREQSNRLHNEHAAMKQELERCTLKIDSLEIGSHARQQPSTFPPSAVGIGGDDISHPLAPSPSGSANSDSSSSHGETPSLMTPNIMSRVSVVNAGEQLIDSILSSASVSSGRRYGQGSILPRAVRRQILAHDDEVFAICFAPNQPLVASGSADKNVKIYDTRTGQFKFPLYGSVQSVNTLQFAPDGSCLFGAGNDTAIRMWSMTTQRILNTFTGHTSKIFEVACAVDGKRIVSGSHDRTLKIWDVQKGFCTKTCICSSSCNSVAVASDVIASGHMDGIVRLWDERTGTKVSESEKCHDQQITCVRFSPDDLQIASCGKDNNINVHDRRMITKEATFSAQNFSCAYGHTRIAYSPDSCLLAGASSSGDIVVWRVRTGRVESTVKGHQGRCAAVSWNMDGDVFGSVGSDRMLVMYEH